MAWFQYSLDWCEYYLRKDCFQVSLCQILKLYFFFRYEEMITTCFKWFGFCHCVMILMNKSLFNIWPIETLLSPSYNRIYTISCLGDFHFRRCWKLKRRKWHSFSVVHCSKYWCGWMILFTRIQTWLWGLIISSLK